MSTNGEAAIIDRINHGKDNQMPAQSERLTNWRFSNIPDTQVVTGTE